jgi:hypothetical protein
MGVTISDEEVKAIGRQRLEEARLTRPHMGRTPESPQTLRGWTRIGKHVTERLHSRGSAGARGLAGR